MAVGVVGVMMALATAFVWSERGSAGLPSETAVMCACACECDWEWGWECNGCSRAEEEEEDGVRGCGEGLACDDACGEWRCECVRCSAVVGVGVAGGCVGRGP